MEICVKHFLGCVKFIFNHDSHGLGCEKILHRNKVEKFFKDPSFLKQFKINSHLLKSEFPEAEFWGQFLYGVKYTIYRQCSILSIENIKFVFRYSHLEYKESTICQHGWIQIITQIIPFSIG